MATSLARTRRGAGRFRGRCGRYESRPINSTGERFLDMGCGTADYLAAVHDVRPDCQFVGIDVSSEMITSTRLRCPWERLDVTDANVALSPRRRQRRSCLLRRCSPPSDGLRALLLRIVRGCCARDGSLPLLQILKRRPRAFARRVLSRDGLHQSGTISRGRAPGRVRATGRWDSNWSRGKLSRDTSISTIDSWAHWKQKRCRSCD